VLAIAFVLLGRYWIFARPFLWATNPHVSPHLPKALILAGIFSVPTLLLQLTFRRDEKKLAPLASVGIIDFSWLSLLSFGVALLWFLTGTPPLCDPIPSQGYSADYYKQYYEFAQLLFSDIVTMLIGVVTVLGVCMTILLSKAKWRPNEKPTTRQDYHETLKSAVKMVWSCLVFLFAFLIWVIAPLHLRMVGVVELTKYAK
jgi:hypothetical protein